MNRTGGLPEAAGRSPPPAEAGDRAAARAELAESIAAGAAGATAALGQARRLIRSSWDVTRAGNAADEVDTIASAVTSAEAQRRIERFVRSL